MKGQVSVAVTKTTLTALAGILIAINLKYQWLPITRDDTEMVAVVLGFLSQIFQRLGVRKAEIAATKAHQAAVVGAAVAAADKVIDCARPAG